MPTENELLAILSVGAACAGALYYMNHNTQTAWQNTLMRMTKESAGHVVVRHLSEIEAFPEQFNDYDEAFERLRRALRRRNGVDDPPVMSDMFEFKIQITSGKVATFRMYPEKAQLVKNSFLINNVITPLNWKHKKKVKDIGLNAYVLWKMGTNL